MLFYQNEKEELNAILGKLKEADRTILILKDREGFSYEEISRITDKPVGTVRSRLHRARARVAALGRQCK
ncbi:MAG: sigma factor-like helix-turn-helix DNA-binding protein [Spirochaetales bacterium]|nr:sigma factor-like helix-turn-helix DNA-binding protein [Spirochaetales bacterium]